MLRPNDGAMSAIAANWDRLIVSHLTHRYDALMARMELYPREAEVRLFRPFCLDAPPAFRAFSDRVESPDQ